MHDVIQLYQKKFGLLSGSQRDKLYQACDEGMSPYVIGCAILRTCQEQRRLNIKGQQKRVSFNYLWGIIEDWLLHGITNEKSFRALWEGQQTKMSLAGNGGRHGKAEVQRQIFDKDYEYAERREAAPGFFTFLDE